MNTEIFDIVSILIAAYLLGSIPTGYWAGRILKGIDIREHGSKSTGATNVLRTLGKGPALLVFLIDIFKGVAAIVLPRWIFSLDAVPTLAPAALDWLVTGAGLAALLGHSRSIWLNFTGGKSAATGLGVLFAMSWPVGLSTAAVFASVLAISRIVSLSSMSAAIASILWMILFQQPLPYVLLAIAGGLYVVIRHRANIQRLRSGTEPKLGQQSELGEKLVAQDSSGQDLSGQESSGQQEV